MHDLQLFTRDGEYVVSVAVPDFAVMPEVLQWGIRIFVWNTVHQQWREGMLYYAQTWNGLNP